MSDLADNGVLFVTKSTTNRYQFNIWRHGPNGGGLIWGEAHFNAEYTAYQNVDIADQLLGFAEAMNSAVQGQMFVHFGVEITKKHAGLYEFVKNNAWQAIVTHLPNGLWQTTVSIRFVSDGPIYQYSFCPFGSAAYMAYSIVRDNKLPGGK